MISDQSWGGPVPQVVPFPPSLQPLGGHRKSRGGWGWRNLFFQEGEGSGTVLSLAE